jgi:MOSC domain-containing protein YiiM
MNAATAHVVSIVFTPKEVPVRRPQGNYARVAVSRASLAEFQGIVGDLKGGTGERQLNIMAAETLAELRGEGFKTEPGELGEQVIVIGIDLANIAAGTRLRLGSAIVEVAMPRTGCARFEMIQGKSKKQVTGRLGVLARVVSGGEVAVGDSVGVVPSTD